MKKHVLFIQGGGDNGYEADAKLADSLQSALGNSYEVIYPQLQSDETASDFGWPRQIGEEINGIEGNIILVAHSVGASLLLKYLSATETSKNISAIYLIATPWWSGNEDWKQGLKLPNDLAVRIPQDIPIFLYHSMDDEVVPVEHLFYICPEAATGNHP